MSRSAPNMPSPASVFAMMPVVALSASPAVVSAAAVFLVRPASSVVEPSFCYEIKFYSLICAKPYVLEAAASVARAWAA